LTQPSFIFHADWSTKANKRWSLICTSPRARSDILNFIGDPERR
jgi:hypothetical protein